MNSAAVMKKALVIDDYKSMRRILSELLTARGFSVIEAEDGQDGLDKLDVDKEVTMVFTDIVMPVMDGFEFCQEMKSNDDFLRVPVVVCSTHSDSDHLLKAINMGADDYLTKPIDPSLLDKVIARLSIAHG